MERHMLTTTRMKSIRHWTLFTICSIVFAVVFVACGGSTTGSNPTPTPRPTQPPQATPSPTSASNALTYTGDGFTIDYPSSWQTSTPAAGQIVFADPTTGAAVRINVVDDTGGQTADAIVTATLQQLQSQNTNFQQLTNVPGTTTLAGDTWSQGGATYDVASNGTTTSYQAVVMADAHPANSATPKGFLIVYVAPPDTFDQANTDDFQPMLQSFTFIS
jgi:hypothetical protein